MAIDNPNLNQWICPRPIKLFGFIPTPWICADICGLIDGTTLRCPTCGTERQFVWKRKRGLA